MSETKQSLHIVIGMPGSGKTTYLERLLADGAIDVYFDDYQKGAPEEDKSDPHLSPNYPALKEAMLSGKSVAIADIRYCLSEEEALITQTMVTDFPEASIVLNYFANDPEACRHNVKLRNRSEYLEIELENIDKFTPQYNPPANQTLPVIIG